MFCQLSLPIFSVWNECNNCFWKAKSEVRRTRQEFFRIEGLLDLTFGECRRVFKISLFYIKFIRQNIFLEYFWNLSVVLIKTFLMVIHQQYFTVKFFEYKYLISNWVVVYNKHFNKLNSLLTFLYWYKRVIFLSVILNYPVHSANTGF